MNLNTITEGYGRTHEFPYEKFSTDPRPRLLLLGKYRHPTTRNILIGGVNLNYLNDEQLKEIRQNLKTILQPKNLQLRYWRGRRLLPDIFQNAYRTYDVDYIGAVTKDTLTFWPSVGELEKAEKAAKDQEMQKYDQEMRTKHKIGRVRPTLAAPEPEAAPTPGDVLTTEPEPTPVKPGGVAPAADVELARPETEVTPEPAAEVGKPPTAQEPTQAGATGAPTEQPEMEAPPAGPMVRGGAGRKETGRGAAPAPKAKKLTSAQRRREQAEQIKKALEASKQKKQKPEPPDELKGVMGMFKPGK
jgi:hypothetical protein